MPLIKWREKRCPVSHMRCRLISRGVADRPVCLQAADQDPSLKRRLSAEPARRSSLCEALGRLQLVQHVLHLLFTLKMILMLHNIVNELKSECENALVFSRMEL